MQEVMQLTMCIFMSFRYRLYPDAETEKRLLEWIKSLRFLWNSALEQKIKNLLEYMHGRPYSPVRYIEQQEQLTEARAFDERLEDVPCVACQGVLRDLDASWSLWVGSKKQREWAHDRVYREAAEQSVKDGYSELIFECSGLEVDAARVNKIWSETGLVYMARDLARRITNKWYRYHRISPPEYKEELIPDEKPEGNGKKSKKKKSNNKSHGMPRFKKFHDSTSMVLYTHGFIPNKHLIVKEQEEMGYIRLPKIGDVPIRYHRPINGEVCTVSVTKEGPEWYVSLACKVQIDDPGLSSKPIVAIDRGVEMTLVDSEGRKACLPERVRKLSRRIDRMKSRNDSRRRNIPFNAPKSKRWQKAQDAISGDYRRCARVRRKWLHDEALYYANNYSVVIIEDLNVQNMTASASGTQENPGTNVKQKSGLNRSIREQGWYTFQLMLAYKLEKRGGMLVSVPAPYSSQTCSSCGCVDVKNRHGRDFRCVECGHQEDADVNAAKILKQRYLAGNFKKIGGYGFQRKPKIRTGRIKRKKKTDQQP